LARARDQTTNQVRIVVVRKVEAVITELEPVFNFEEFTTGIVVVPFIDRVTVGLLRILKNKVTRNSG